jgi:hypothetical protein
MALHLDCSRFLALFHLLIIQYSILISNWLFGICSSINLYIYLESHFSVGKQRNLASQQRVHRVIGPHNKFVFSFSFLFRGSFGPIYNLFYFKIPVLFSSLFSLLSSLLFSSILFYSLLSFPSLPFFHFFLFFISFIWHLLTE